MRMRLHMMIGSPNASVKIVRNGRSFWMRAVPEPFYGGLFDRIRDAWSVIRGDTFAIYWPKPGELEDALTTGRQPPNNVE